MGNGDQHYVTSDEFTRYIQEEANFRSRLEQRLANDHATLRTDLGEIKGLVKETNGRVIKAERELGVLQRDFEALRSSDVDIGQIVNKIHEDGCNVLREHRAVLESGGDLSVVAMRPQFRMDHFTARQKMVGISGLAIVMWPAIQELAKLLQELLKWFSTHAIRPIP